MLIVLTIGILYILRLNESEESDNKIKNLFNKSKEVLLIICMLIITYNMNSCDQVKINTKVPDVFTGDAKF